MCRRIKEAICAQKVHYVRRVNFNGSRDSCNAPFLNFVRGHVWTVAGNMDIKFEVRVFSHVGEISL